MWAFVSPSHAVCYPSKGQSAAEAGGYSASADQSSRARITGYHSKRFLKGLPSLVLHVVRLISLKKHFLETSPLRNNRRFWQSAARLDWARRRHGFLLHTVTRLLRPRLPHYYGFICHLTPRQRLLELPLEVTYRSHPPWRIAGQCQASPVTVLAPC